MPAGKPGILTLAECSYYWQGCRSPRRGTFVMLAGSIAGPLDTHVVIRHHHGDMAVAEPFHDVRRRAVLVRHADDEANPSPVHQKPVSDARDHAPQGCARPACCAGAIR